MCLAGPVPLDDPPCPNGTRVKDESPVYLWIEGAALCGMIGWARLIMGVACDFFVNQLVNTEEMCSELPPPIPEVNWLTEIVPFPGFAMSQNMLRFWYAVWVNANWHLHCECIPGVGTGTCPPVAEVGGTVTTSWFTGYKLCATVAIPHGWSSIDVTRRRGSDANIGNMYISYTLTTATGAVVGNSRNANAAALAPGASHTSSVGGSMTPAEREAVRYLNIWGQPTGTGGQGASTDYTFAGYGYPTFYGTCNDVTVEPEPPEPADEPPRPPDIPDQPLPAECTASTICSLLMALMAQGRHTGQLVTLLQRYRLPFNYVLGTAYANLSGSGSLAIADLVGLKIDLTAGIPGRQLEGNPPYIWDVGWMSVMTADGMIMEQRITRDTMVWQPDLIQEATVFGYFFKAGVVATVTELYPEAY